jgi:peptidoglycan/xylan/chitin deacetylase (PgdA/CDA1 family)
VLLHHLRRKDIPVLSADQYLEGRDGALITLDDGHPHDLKVAYPILEEFEACAISFLIPLEADLRPRVKEWEAWRAAAGRIEVGSHTLTHGKVAAAPPVKGEAPPNDPNRQDFFATAGSDYRPALTARQYLPLMGRSETEAERRARLSTEIAFSKYYMERQLGLPVRFLSYPWGEWDELCVELAREAGYRAAFSLDRTDGTDWTIPRVHLEPFAEELRRLPRPGGGMRL